MYLYVVLLVTRIHQAVVYEMPTAAAPEKAMVINKNVRVSEGLKDRVHISVRSQVRCFTYKLRLRFSVPQSSMTIEQMVKIGIHNKLL
jgi:hypothetical protein